MGNWTVVEAKAKFSELLDRVREYGPQIVTRHGKPSAIVVSAEEWGRRSQRRGTLVEFFAASPLANSEILIERVKDEPRKLDL